MKDDYSRHGRILVGIESSQKPRIVRDYRDLIVWQRSITLVKLVYQLTKGFPREELFGLSSQLRRASVSIPSNIAEGQQRKSTNEYKHHLSFSLGSLAEVDTQLVVATELHYVNEVDLQELQVLICEIRKMLNGLSSSL